MGLFWNKPKNQVTPEDLDALLSLADLPNLIEVKVTAVANVESIEKKAANKLADARGIERTANQTYEQETVTAKLKLAKALSQAEDLASDAQYLKKTALRGREILAKIPASPTVAKK